MRGARRVVAVGLMVVLCNVASIRVVKAESRSYLDWSAGVDAAMAVFESGDFERAAAMLGPLAETGDADAQFILGRFYHEGFGVDQNECRGFDWHRKAAAQKHALALPHVGMAITKAKRTYYDESKIRKYYEQAVELGDAAAASMMSAFSLYTNLPGYDRRSRFEWAQRAWRMSTQGQELDGEALLISTLLAMASRQGNGSSDDIDQVEQLYLIGAMQGLDISQFGLGNLYLEHRGRSMFSEGLQWILLAAHQGHPEAVKVGERVLDDMSWSSARAARKAMRDKFDSMVADPRLVIGEAAAWCFSDRPGSQECLRFAFKEHHECDPDVGSTYFKDRYVGSQAYRRCRSEARE